MNISKNFKKKIYMEYKGSHHKREEAISQLDILRHKIKPLVLGVGCFLLSFSQQ